MGKAAPARNPLPEHGPGDIDAVLRMVAREVEALVDGRVYYSRTAYTPRMGVHVVIANGAIKLEGEPAQEAAGLFDAAAKSVAVAKGLRDQIAGDAVLVWRAEPQYEGGILRMRLCFEAK